MVVVRWGLSLPAFCLRLVAGVSLGGAVPFPPLIDQLPGPFAGSGGRRGAVRGAENSPRRREGMEERAALRGARTSGQAGQEQAGAPGTLSPKAPRSLTLPGAE